MFKYCLLTLVLLNFISLASAEEDSLSFATYYPAPYGNYREMRAMRMAIGDNYVKTSEYDWETGAMNLIDFSADLIVEGNVGIGTARPQTPAPNDLAGNLDVNDLYLRSTSQWISRGGSVPVGVISAFGGTTPPTGYLMCDGANNISRTTYAALFAVIGTIYGTGADGNTFKLPDLRQKFPMGKAASDTGATLGGTGGTVDANISAPAHTHELAEQTTMISGVPAIQVQELSGGPFSYTVVYKGTAYSYGAGYTSLGWWTTSGGGGASSTYNPPFQVVNYIIKY